LLCGFKPLFDFINTLYVYMYTVTVYLVLLLYCIKIITGVMFYSGNNCCNWIAIPANYFNLIVENAVLFGDAYRSSIKWIVEAAKSVNWHLQLFKYITFISIIIQEEFEESKEVIRIRKLKDRQRNGQKK
jgi:hypothetical protein